MPRVFSTNEFDAWEHLLDKVYKKEIDKIIIQLKESSQIGKQLGYPFFREKKFGKYRIYFLIYDDLDSVLLITISDKKAQQETIDRIKSYLEGYKEIIYKQINAL